MATWEEFRRAVKMWDDVELRTSSDADLDAYEAARGVKLPQSYREFANTFGRCEVGNTNRFQFAAPGHDDGSGSFVDLASLDAEMGKNAKADRDPIRHSVLFFASDEGGDTYGWNLPEVTDAVRNEYAVYLRTDSNVPYRKVAPSFDEFVLVHCFGEDLQAWRDATAGGDGARDDDPDDDNDPRILVDPM